MSYLDDFREGYVTCALWSSTDDVDPEGQDNRPLDENYGADDISPELLAEIDQDCRAFLDENRELLDAAEYEPRGWTVAEQAGHDFWLTRNGHGAGFWDRGLGEIGDKLTAAAHAYGETDWYVGDDGKLYA